MKLLKDFILRTVGGDSILVPIGKTSQEFNGVINLSETAACIWSGLENGLTPEEIINTITKEYDIDTETASKDTHQFIRELIANGFLEKDE